MVANEVRKKRFKSAEEGTTEDNGSFGPRLGYICQRYYETLAICGSPGSRIDFEDLRLREELLYLRCCYPYLPLGVPQCSPPWNQAHSQRSLSLRDYQSAIPAGVDVVNPTALGSTSPTGIPLLPSNFSPT